MADKIYLSADAYLKVCYQLADRIYRDAWLPQCILAVWRGGAPVGMTIHEYLRYRGRELHHDAVKCASYTGIRAREAQVAVELPEHLLKLCTPGYRVLVTDDIFDSGNTMQALLERLAPTQADVRIATPYWHRSHNKTTLSPDYYLEEVEQWLVFPHEMEGLTLDEIQRKNAYLGDLLAQ